MSLSYDKEDIPEANSQASTKTLRRKHTPTPPKFPRLTTQGSVKLSVLPFNNLRRR